ncbi:hypothetical protein NUM_72880 [Actinocatenispora comari]|uniref:Uncharacterized protein n=1 Tax=Actinocatenispora comari TaxID=2807577 RepID=A0A8J4ESK5_9ACTN|nr:hypothetical protein NUM_72880 [Actinocatenispora comari]
MRADIQWECTVDAHPGAAPGRACGDGDGFPAGRADARQPKHGDFMAGREPLPHRIGRQHPNVDLPNGRVMQVEPGEARIPAFQHRPLAAVVAAGLGKHRSGADN